MEELSRLREYLNSVIAHISYEYLMSFFMNSYTRWIIQLARSSISLPSSVTLTSIQNGHNQNGHNPKRPQPKWPQAKKGNIKESEGFG